jgi:DNA-binding FadR family transcriptional regulator
MIYPLMINSFKVVYTNFSRRFFVQSHLAERVFAQHRALVNALAAQKTARSAQLMKELLTEGALSLKNYLKESQQQ